MGSKSWCQRLEQNQINMKQIKHLILIVLISVSGMVKAQQVKAQQVEAQQVENQQVKGQQFKVQQVKAQQVEVQKVENQQVNAVAASGTKESFLTLAGFAVKSKVTNAQIVDARTAEEFTQNHLKGAVNIDPASTAYAKAVDALIKDRPVFVYSIGNGRSVSVAKELRSKGFKEVHVLPGGIANWIGSGYPIVSTTEKGLSLSSAQFKTLTGSSGLVLVDFGSKYCGACKKLIPVLDSLEKKQDFKTKVVRIEAYDNVLLLRELKVSQLPTLVLYQGGKQVWKKAGLSSTAEIEKIINTKRHE